MPEQRAHHGWSEGLAVLGTALVVVFIAAGQDYGKELQFQKLNALKDAIDIKVIRNGKQVGLVGAHSHSFLPWQRMWGRGPGWERVGTVNSHQVPGCFSTIMELHVRTRPSTCSTPPTGCKSLHSVRSNVHARPCLS